MKRIEILLTQSLIQDDLILKDKNVIVLDVLRATTTMTIALANGAKEIIPTENIATAVRVAKGSKNSILCGERNGKVVEGFSLGNSPTEYTPDVVKDKSLIFSTTNGTLAIIKSKFAKTCLICSFINISAIVDYVNSMDEDFTLICSGKLNDFCLEDAVCAGMLLSKLSAGRTLIMEDSEIAAMNLCNDLAMLLNVPSQDKVLKMFHLSEHGKYLKSIGFENDLDICSRIDSYPFLPIFRNGVVRFKEQFQDDSEQRSKMKRINIGAKKEDIKKEKVSEK
ncbi:MAG TPA: 2-phosphosulfolactate phosphatase [Ignavibacteria bacterium]|nr:2-phosphosulfolactate phosphatase [Ignavibacteria bacterium]HMR41273.1 2-phosphosulfolactate phosphatase [Ignavibacteria bacterium]